MPFRQFIYSLGSRSSAPGGGSASAAIGAMVSLVKGLITWEWITVGQSAVIEFVIFAEVHITEEILFLIFQEMALKTLPFRA